MFDLMTFVECRRPKPQLLYSNKKKNETKNVVMLLINKMK